MPVVELPQGGIRGRSEGGVLVFRGIPYARPPVGELRFAPPAPPVSWTGVRDARRFSPAAPQMGTEAGAIGKLFRVIRGGISEDCLYLNVWTPGTDDGKRPVVVYLHGGAFVLGAGSTFLYSGLRFAASGVVLVTLNYRLGAFGFLDLTGLAADGGPPANLGLRDQLAALGWVRDNIAAFGGDPDNVTLYGESAGAMSAGVHLALEGPRRFRRAILSSGAAANVSTPEEAAYVSRRFLEALSLAADDWRRLKDLPMERLLLAQRRALHGDPSRMGLLPWQPSVDGDLVRRQPLESIRTGAGADLGVLIGSNREEWKLFAAGAPHLRAMTPEALRRRATRLLGRSGLDPGAAGRLIEHHGRRSDGSRRSPFETWVAIRTEQFFLLPALELAEARAPHGARTYFYRLDFPAPRMPRYLGSCHGLDLGLAFGTFRHPFMRPVYGGGREVRRLSAAIGEAWASFARTGVPGWSDGPQWRPFTLDGRETLALDSASHVFRGPEADCRSVWQRG